MEARNPSKGNSYSRKDRDTPFSNQSIGGKIKGEVSKQF